MVTVQKNIIIATPAQVIWSILENPAWSGKLNPNFKLLYCFESRLGGYNQVFRYSMGGQELEGSTDIVAYETGRHLCYETSGALQSCWHWWLEGDGRQTHVSLTFDYRVPKVLRKLEAGVLEQENCQAMQTCLTNLKRVAEQMG